MERHVLSNGKFKTRIHGKTYGKFATRTNEKYECSYGEVHLAGRESGVKVFWTLIFEMESLNDGRVVYYAQ